MIMRDWFHAGYEAAVRRDHENTIAVIGEISKAGRPALEAAARNWISRTITVMNVVTQTDASTHVEVDLEPDDSAGETHPVDDASREVAWAARLFMAYRSHNSRAWSALWNSLPDDEGDALTYVHALLTTMTATASAYAEDDQPAAPTCRCEYHRIVHGVDPMTVAARMATAHLN